MWDVNETSSRKRQLKTNIGKIENFCTLKVEMIFEGVKNIWFNFSWIKSIQFQKNLNKIVKKK